MIEEMNKGKEGGEQKVRFHLLVELYFDPFFEGNDPPGLRAGRIRPLEP